MRKPACLQNGLYLFDFQNPKVLPGEAIAWFPVASLKNPGTFPRLNRLIIQNETGFGTKAEHILNPSQKTQTIKTFDEQS
jgi:hypothetical protein